jgi:hypothetical protein
VKQALIEHETEKKALIEEHETEKSALSMRAALVDRVYTDMLLVGENLEPLAQCQRLVARALVDLSDLII